MRPPLADLAFMTRLMALTSLLSIGAVYLAYRSGWIHQAPRLRVVLLVQDSGEGIRPEDLPHVFERFYRGEKSRSRQAGGSGLGLAIAKGNIEGHDGKITVESQLGRGSVFCLLLPV